jgi:hypothetical protein
LVIQPDGRIVVAGVADPGRFALALALQPDGSVVVMGGGHPPGEETSAFLVIQPDDKIVGIGGASGNLSGTRRGPALARYLG